VLLTTDAQVRKLMEEHVKRGKVGVAALRAGMHRNTAAKYVAAGKLPSELAAPRTWRTREDPFADDWPAIAVRLTDAPELEAVALFEALMAEQPGRYEPGQVRTLQRRMREWRAQEGPPKRMFFAQEHRPGEALQTDFTWATELEVTIAGVAFPHMLCHVVLPYSNWSWATVCRSESLLAIRRGVQAAVFRLGRIPRFHQTDNSTAATHELGQDEQRRGKHRGFNEDYKTFIEHLGMTPRTIEVGEKEQNGDVEALNGVLKRRLRQHLLLRRSRDFESVEAYEAWLWAVLTQANQLRAKRLREDLAAMRELVVSRLPEYTEEEVRVSTWSTIRVKYNAYSVPARLIGEVVRVRVYEDRLEVFHGGKHQLTMERLQGQDGHRVDYRHIIWSLVRKPGAFARYCYREELFPTLAFRRAYDALSAAHAGIQADVEYLKILHLAASTMESEVEAALALLLDAEQCPDSAQVKALVQPREAADPVDLAVPQVDLCAYDALLRATEVAS
jgi:transposase InsO family protein